MHCIIVNNLTLLRELMLERRIHESEKKSKQESLKLKRNKSEKKEPRFKKDAQDVQGKSAVHILVNPLEYGSFENIDILKFLVEKSFNLTLKDKLGHTPDHYAMLQESGVLSREFQIVIGSKAKKAQP